MNLLYAIFALLLSANLLKRDVPQGVALAGRRWGLSTDLLTINLTC